jgi:hypothetical protein
MRHGLAGAAAALGVAGVLVLGGCSSGDDGRYATESVRRADVVERVSAPGAVQAVGQAELKAPAAARVIEGFGARLRDQVDLDGLTGELLAVVDQTMAPTRAWLWLRPPAAPARSS